MIVLLMYFGTGFDQMNVICFSQGTVATLHMWGGYIYNRVMYTKNYYYFSLSYFFNSRCHCFFEMWCRTWCFSYFS